ncbi:MAG: 50S ribosomal protein L9 [Deltaproteobacteria bacterium]|nr:50S ribosomal protein L9 [Deltaproteobacteria bacterium]
MGKAIHVILQRDVQKLGKGGEVVKVAAGFARNYLLPQGFALPASEGNVARFEHEKRVSADKAARVRAAAADQATKLSAVELTIARTVGAEGKLYGSVTTKDVEAALKARGFEVDRKKLHADAIRALGTYDVTARLAPELTATFKVHVVAQG